MLLGLKDAAKSIFESLGLDIRFHREPLRLLRSSGIRTVLDIGANAGQFAAHIRKVLPEARIYSFEPLAAPFHKLVHAMRGDGNFEAFQVAVGSQEGESDFDMHEFSVASSMLQPSEKFARIVPAVVERTTVRVPVITLDRWAERHELATPLLLKMDVQGFEDHVIRGGRKTIGLASAVISEVSFAGLYQGQPLFEDILQLMASLDFRCGGMLDSFCDKETGEILEADALFLPRPRGMNQPS